MAPYFALITLWISLAVLLEVSGKDSNSRRVFVVVAGTSLFALLASRAATVGTDLVAYSIQYADGFFRDDEPGISLLMDLTNALSLPFQAFLAIVALIVVVSVSYLYYHYSPAPLLSFVLFVSFGLLAMSMTGLRQILAVSVTIWAFIALTRGARIWFFLLVALASTFHLSAIIFFPVYLLRHIAITRIRALVAFVGVGIGAFVFGTIDTVDRVVEFLALDSYQRSVLEGLVWSPNPATVLVAAAVPVLCLALWPKDGAPATVVSGVESKLNIPSLLFLLSLAFFATSIINLNVPLAGRLGYYFVAYATLLVPIVVTAYPFRGVRHLAYAVVLILAIVQFAIVTPGSSLGIDDYKPFWSADVER